MRLQCQLSMKNSKIILKWNIFLLSITTPHEASADTNMKDANFFKNWIDHVIARDRRDFKMRRTYSSRSLHQGVFGFGWCSDLDIRIQAKDMNTIELSDCKIDKKIVFVKHSKNNNYTNTNDPRDLLIANGDVYTRKLHGTTTQRFGKDGKQIFNSSWIKNVHFGKFKQIEEIEFSDQTKTMYTYSGRDLTSVVKNKVSLFRYKYDNFHNLTQITYPDNSSEHIAYDTDHDRVKSIQGRNNCTEHFTFTQSNPSDSNYFASTVQKKCGGLKELKTRYEFWHKYTKSGDLYLDHVRIHAGKNTTEVSYHPTTGAAIHVHDNNRSRVAAFEKNIKGDLNNVYEPILQKNN